jgi:DNA-binding HxlR family transcriptional regulator
MISSMDGDEREICTRHLTAFCPTYHRAIELIGRRWTGAILRAMLSGEARFSDIAAAVPGLSDRLLSERLKELEAEGIVRRTVVPSTPVRIDYALTDKGLALNEVIVAVSDWAEHWLASVDEPVAVGDR